MEGEQVCCTSGKRLDFKPKLDANGVCATYTTHEDNKCSKLAAACDLNVTDLENFNKTTWLGLERLLVTLSRFQDVHEHGKPTHACARSGKMRSFPTLQKFID